MVKGEISKTAGGFAPGGRLVLLISHEMSLSGAPRSLLRQACYMRDAGLRVLVWTMLPGRMESRYADEGFCVETVSPEDRSVLRRRIEDLAPDLAVCNTFKTYRFVDVLVSLRIPAIWFIRETGDLKAPLAHDRDFRRVFLGFYNLYTVSEYACGIIAQYNSNVRFFNNSVEDSFRGFTLPGEVLRFGFIGSTVRRKGLRELLAAFRAVFGDRRDVELRIAGAVDGSEEGELLRKRYASLASVVWLGEVTGESKQAFFDSIDVLCMPSLDEPAGLSLLEGAMQGKALLATETVGAGYIVGEGNGRVVPVADLFGGLAYFDAHRAELPAMQRESRRMYLQYATPDRERAAVLEMVERNLGNVPPEPAQTRPVRQFFKKTDVDADHWRFYLWGVPVLTCRKCKRAKRFARGMLRRLGLDPARFGFTPEE